MLAMKLTSYEGLPILGVLLQVFEQLGINLIARIDLDAVLLKERVVILALDQVIQDD
jgi:hypothetical protein